MERIATTPSVRLLLLTNVVVHNCLRRLQNGNSNIYIRKFSLRTGRHWVLWLGCRLLHLGRSGLTGFSQDESRSQPEPGPLGFLDAWLHAVSNRHLPIDRIDMVQRI